MKRHLTLTFLALSTLLGSLNAATDTPPATETNPYHSRRHAIGVQASSIAGMGLNYKYAFGDLLHWRVTGMVFPSRSGNVTSTYSNIGTDLQINFLQSAISQNLFFRSYIAPAISYWQTTYSDGFSYPELHAGATLGFEIVLESRVNVHGDLGLGYCRRRYPDQQSWKLTQRTISGFTFHSLAWIPGKYFR